MNLINIIVYSEPGVGRTIADSLSTISAFKDVFAASDAPSAIDYIKRNKDAVALIDVDYKPPGHESVCDYIKKRGVRNIALCSSKKEIFTLLSTGYDDTIIKWTDNSGYADFLSALHFKIRAVFDRPVVDKQRVIKKDYGRNFNKIIVIGSSTGGTEAVKQVLAGLPADVPPILVVQHMPEHFTKIYAERLHSECKMSVWEAKNEDRLRNGLCLIAPGRKQMRLEHTANGEFFAGVFDDTQNSLHVPSVNVLFNSVAGQRTLSVIGVILTGMGSDGAEGMLKMRTMGAYTIGQDRESSVVYGMPKAAFDIGAVCEQASIDKIAGIILSRI